MPADRADAIDTFLAASGWGAAGRTPLPGDASTRRYVRLDMNGRRAMLMDQPQNAETPAASAGATPEERRALGYNAVARLAGADCARFVAASNYLRKQGLSAPEIYAADPKNGFVIIEDLGDALYADVVTGENERSLYGAAAEVLAKLHADRAPARLPPDKDLHAFDETALIAETDLLPEWFIPLALKRAATSDERAEHQALWRAALKDTLGASPVFVHRDYHAQNLLWLPQRDGAARVGLIDFQDAVAGSKAYDLISLVEDARRDVPADIAAATTAHYLDAMRAQGTPLDENRFRGEMAVMAAQRNAKIAGIFARLFARDGKPRYLGYLPRVWGYLNADLEHPALAGVKAWYDRVIPREKRGNPQGGGSVTAPKRAMIMAAGLGTRMRPLTDDKPKPLVKVAGRTLIDHALDRLAAAGVTLAVVNIHYKAEMVKAHLARRKDIEIRFSEETGALLGTGGGVVKALPHFEGEPFYIVNSDTIWVEGVGHALDKMVARWDAGAMDGLLLMASMVTAIGYEGAGDFMMDSDGHLSRVPERRLSPFAYPGVQIVHPRLFDGAPQGGFSTNRMWDVAIAKQRLYGIRLEGVWIHVGTPEAVKEAEDFLADLPPVDSRWSYDD